ncbi:MAG: molecular chaperone TorD family protein [Anaerolineae bacterium]
MEVRAPVRAELYASLAEALAEPPAWLAGAGRDWPLFEAAVRAARDGSQAARRAVEALAAIRPESLSVRRRRYQALFAGAGRPRLWLHESLHMEGRLLGAATLAVERVYRVAGLAVEGAELPDHASVELAFLGWLAAQEAAHRAQSRAWRRLARRFIRRHAGRWLPELGRALAASGDPVYAPLGRLLAGWLAEAVRPPRRLTLAGTRLPVISQNETCTLCGFCAQVCPSRALFIRETGAETGLILLPSACTGCGRCEQVCEFGALQLAAPGSDRPGPLVLRRSPRAVCPGCGQPTVSQAEIEAIAAGLGERPAWLDYCLDCRPRLSEAHPRVCRSCAAS